MNLLFLIRTISSTISKESKSQHNNYVLMIISSIISISAFAWLVHISSNQNVICYIGFGSILMAVWGNVMATGGWVLEAEIGTGTLDFMLISYSPLSTILFSKILANAIFILPSGIVNALIIFLIAGKFPHVEQVFALCISFLFAFLGIIVIGLFSCVLVVLVGGRPGVFMGLIPLGTVLGGFIIPLDNMPMIIKFLSMCFPSSWAMNALWYSIGFNTGLWNIIFDWSIFISLSLIWLIISIKLCKKSERRIKFSGKLSHQW